MATARPEADRAPTSAPVRTEDLTKVYPGNVKAVVESDAINPVALAMLVPDGTPVLLTCSDSDGQARCDAVQPMAAALAHTRLEFVALKGASHVLKDDPSDSITNYAKDQPLSQKFVSALDGFVKR